MLFTLVILLFLVGVQVCFLLHVVLVCLTACVVCVILPTNWKICTNVCLTLGSWLGTYSSLWLYSLQGLCNHCCYDHNNLYPQRGKTNTCSPAFDSFPMIMVRTCSQGWWATELEQQLLPLHLLCLSNLLAKINLAEPLSELKCQLKAKSNHLGVVKVKIIV